MKRTLNSIYATLLFSILANSEKTERSSPYLAFLHCFSLLPFSLSSCCHSKDACFNHDAAESMPLSLQYRFEGNIFERNAASIVPGPAKADCGKIRLGRRPVHHRLGCTCSFLARRVQSQLGDYRGLLNYSVFFGEIIMNAIITA